MKGLNKPYQQVFSIFLCSKQKFNLLSIITIIIIIIIITIIIVIRPLSLKLSEKSACKESTVR